MHKYVTHPAMTQEDKVCKAAHDLIKALKGKRNTLGDEQEHDLKNLSEIFQEVAKQKAHSPATTPTNAQPQQQANDKHAAG